MRSDTIPDSHNLLDDLKQRLLDRWDSLKAVVRQRFHLLSDDDVNAVEGRYDELSKRVASAHGYDDARTHEEISRFLSEGGGSADHAPDVRASPASRPSNSGHEH